MTNSEKDKDAKRLESYIVRENLVSCMNNTKWGELRNTMLGRLSPPKYRLKCIRDEASPYWDAEWYYHLPPFKEIEWIEINPQISTRKGHLVADEIDDQTEELTRLLEANSIPYEIRNENIWIYGYRRPSE